MSNYFEATERAEDITSDILKKLDSRIEDEGADIANDSKLYEVHIGRGIIELLGKIAHELEIANKGKG